MKKLNWQKIFVFLVFVLIYWFLISQIPWSLVFSNTMVAGGDTGSHNAVVYYSQKIFPKIKWWSPDWYAGFPFLYFYPPLLYYFTVLLSYLIPLNIAFKIVTLLGTFLLPLSIYFFLMLCGFSFPIPSFGAVLSLNYLFLEKFSIYGGNLPSTLAGEFSYSLAFALIFLFLGFLIKGMRENRFLVLNIFLLALISLVHPFSVIVAVLAAGFLSLEAFFVKKIKTDFFYLLKVFIGGFCLSAFWSLPFLALLPYTSKMSWLKTINLEEIFPSSLVFFQILAFLGAIYALFSWKKEKNIRFVLYILIAALIPFLTLNHSSIWNTRFLPFILISFLMLAGYFLGTCLPLLIKKILFFVRGAKARKIQPIASGIILIFFTSFLVFRFIPANLSFIPFWLKWNYEGIEAKEPWPEIKELFAYLKDLPFGRIMWEYRGEYDKFGTPRVLENLPIFTGKPTFEGLLIESSVSSYFHFINQAETTKTPTSAVAGFEYPDFNFENGAEHLRLFGAQYFVAFTEEIKKLADKQFKPLKNFGEFKVYQVPDSELVMVIKDLELRRKDGKWLDESISWYKEMDFSRFIVFYQNKKEFLEINSFLGKTEEEKTQSQEIAQPKIEIKKISDDSLTFLTDQIGQPHLIKYSYFPGWQVKGAKGPYLISPSFMMVIPEQNEVSLSYGYNIWDKIGIVLSFGALFFLVSERFLPIVKKPKKLEDR